MRYRFSYGPLAGLSQARAKEFHSGETYGGKIAEEEKVQSREARGISLAALSFGLLDSWSSFRATK
ncbi:hypothetical protein [Amycolatopsis sp. NPDC004079]|uniref:hypothetical protein n=1 Tax=Amycolatopsis sp. NPDC004079 TaxID=3154549 RepID=UPI0033BD7C9E